MAKLGGFVTFCYFLALVAGIIALFLPFWSSVEVEVVNKTVSVMKKTESGLWWSRESYSISDQALKDLNEDDSWKSITDTHKDTKGVKAIKGVIIIGLGFLCIVMFLAGCTRCCANESNKFRINSIVFGSGVVAIIAGILIGIGPILYYTDVKEDYDFERDDLEWCYWTAVGSACAAIAAGIIGILGCLWSFRSSKKMKLDD
ncbi:uncharacterized protein LOC132719458 [Ruditapes philippinarum]|uniref:uncharacterized protein LOC132719458 n=1 Tax=Ruditapes philippinarum TaxID=129788 RepID=UPI00295ACEF1|nr:uncharacterized protein LOC132719458 [Ruditapes philippinarum]